MPLISPTDDDHARRLSWIRNGKAPKDVLGKPPYYYNVGYNGDSPTGHHQRAKHSKKTLPSILSPHMMPDFPDAGEDLDSREHGFSAFTKSQIMDNDTQTNFNIVDYHG